MMSTGYAFEPAPAHVYSGHPEHPNRLQHLRPLLGSMGATEIEVRPATRDEIRLVHTPAMIDSITEACRQDETIIDFAPTFVTRASLDCALRAAGGTIDCVRHVLDGEASNAFSIVRPPGHHAEPDRAMGFCLFNNAAVAAASALESGLQRIAVVDYDAHHGNGTQAAFAEDTRVAYLSTHQWGIYPGTGWFADAPQARSRIVNVPLPAMSGDRTYARVVEGIVVPFIRRFKPELLLVSAGFDAHWSDPITTLGLSSAGFHQISRRLVELADEYCSGRIVFVLEGGYEPANVANGALAVFAALEHKSFVDPQDVPPDSEPDVDERLASVRALHGF
jgi:acetoin utilization deacetylase AcuC-like enzyme